MPFVWVERNQPRNIPNSASAYDSRFRKQLPIELAQRSLQQPNKLKIPLA